jgi:membrane-associated protein
MNLEYILTTFGYLGIFAIIFAESGLMIGFFLPGDSLLFAAGVAASKGIFNIWLLLIISFVAAVTGDSVGYTFGHTVGRKLFNKKDSVLFKKEYLEKAEHFYIDHGNALQDLYSL